MKSLKEATASRLKVGDKVRVLENVFSTMFPKGNTGTVVVVREGWDDDKCYVGVKPDEPHAHDGGYIWTFYEHELEVINKAVIDFSVGDCVRVIEGSPYNEELKVGMLGQVTDVSDYGAVLVRFKGWEYGHNGNTGGHSTEYRYFNVNDPYNDEGDIEKVEDNVDTTIPVTFKVGDTVRARYTDFFGDVVPTMLGTVTLVLDDCFVVRFPGWTDGHSGREDYLNSEHWYFSQREGLYNLSLVQWEPKPVSTKPYRIKATQPVNAKVLRHLREHDYITPSIAWTTYGISRLAAAIHALRSDGYDITTEMREDAVGHRYARYSFA